MMRHRKPWTLASDRNSSSPPSLRVDDEPQNGGIPPPSRGSAASKWGQGPLAASVSQQAKMEEGREEQAVDEKSSAELAALLESERKTALWKPAVLTVCFFGIITADILKGGGVSNPLHLTCGSPEYWITTLSSIPWVCAFFLYIRWCILDDYHRKIRLNYPFVEVRRAARLLGGSRVKGRDPELRERSHREGRREARFDLFDDQVGSLVLPGLCLCWLRVT